MGSMLDVGWGDLIDYLGDDPGTHSIVMYMESIGDTRSFLSAAREVALTKPLIVIKAGRSAEAARAAASHTGALTGRDDVLDAAFRRSGVLRVDTIAELFNLAEALAKQPRPKGPNLTILTNAGGPGVLATDALIAGHGRLTQLSDATLEALDGILPPHWSHGNPIGAGDERVCRRARDRRARSGERRTPRRGGAAGDPPDIARKVAECPRSPASRSWPAGSAGRRAQGIEISTGRGSQRSRTDAAVRTFNFVWRYGRDLRAL
jgi:acetyltransferase